VVVISAVGGVRYFRFRESVEVVVGVGGIFGRIGVRSVRNGRNIAYRVKGIADILEIVCAVSRYLIRQAVKFSRVVGVGGRESIGVSNKADRINRGIIEVGYVIGNCLNLSGIVVAVGDGSGGGIGIGDGEDGAEKVVVL